MARPQPSGRKHSAHQLRSRRGPRTKHWAGSRFSAGPHRATAHAQQGHNQSQERSASRDTLPPHPRQTEESKLLPVRSRHRLQPLALQKGDRALRCARLTHAPAYLPTHCPALPATVAQPSLTATAGPPASASIGVCGPHLRCHWAPRAKAGQQLSRPPLPP